LGPDNAKGGAMRSHFGVFLVIAALAGIVTGTGGITEPIAQAKGKKMSSTPSTKKDVNACGCYKDTAGACFCGRKGKCACPGDCEPKGCEEKRAKAMQKEIAAETKKAAEADKKQRKASHDSAAKPAKHKPDGVGQ
jgi:hypothetical protein